jgi:hypothetical protein
LSLPVVILNMAPVEVPLSWERLLWSHASWWRSRPRYMLTDLRVVSIDRRGTAELAVQDIDDVQLLRTTTDRVMGASTLVLRSRRRHVQPITLRHVRRGTQLAALLELLAGDPAAAPDAVTVESVLAWTPSTTAMPVSRLVAGLAVAALAVSAVVIALHGESPAVAYPEHDRIRPGGEKRDREAIVEFMETEVLPWARVTLGPLKGGADRVGCETCHGVDPDSRNWTMPSVAALPEPQVQEYGSEHIDAAVDAQMRNAMYGYLAESDKQAKAAYMRQVVVPGMAQLLGRPAYDFTRTYEYNRTHFAIGCYHCHRGGGN